MPAMTQRQLAEAMAYYRLEPWGPERDELHAAMICAETIRPWTKRKVKLEHFRLRFGPSAKTKPESLSSKLRSVAHAIGAKVVDGKRR